MTTAKEQMKQELARTARELELMQAFKAVTAQIGLTVVLFGMASIRIWSQMAKGEKHHNLAEDVLEAQLDLLDSMTKYNEHCNETLSAVVDV